MGKRTKQRTKMVLPIRVWGMDSAGKPFSQLAHTLDINRTGARLGGFRGLLALGDVIGIQYRHMKARFRVVWVARPGSGQENQIGVECLESTKDIWGLNIEDQPIHDEFEPPAEDPEKRAFGNRSELRFHVSGSADVRTERGDNTGGQVVDLSLRGCYVESFAPLKARTPVTVRMRVEGVDLEFGGVVRTCHPGVGMGVEFVEENGVQAKKLKTLLERMQSAPRPSGPPARPKPDSKFLAQRLQKISNDLRDVDDLLKAIQVDPVVLREFRGALGHVRNTSWAVQRWVELQGNQDDPFPVLIYLNTERIRLATQICRSLHDDLEAAELELQKQDLQELLRVFEILFASLADMDFDLLSDNEQGRLTPKAAKAESEA